jgi:hypothetical protein
LQEITRKAASLIHTFTNSDWNGDTLEIAVSIAGERFDGPAFAVPTATLIRLAVKASNSG